MAPAVRVSHQILICVSVIYQLALRWTQRMLLTDKINKTITWNKKCVGVSRDQWKTSNVCGSLGNFKIRWEFCLKTVPAGSSDSRRLFRVRDLSIKLLSCSTPASPSTNKNIRLYFYIYVSLVVCQDTAVVYYISRCNLQSFLLRCSTRLHDWGTLWESNSLVKAC